MKENDSYNKLCEFLPIPSGGYDTAGGEAMCNLRSELGTVILMLSVDDSVINPI